MTRERSQCSRICLKPIEQRKGRVACLQLRLQQRHQNTACILGHPSSSLGSITALIRQQQHIRFHPPRSHPATDRSAVAPPSCTYIYQDVRCIASPQPRHWRCRRCRRVHHILPENELKSCSVYSPSPQFREHGLTAFLPPVRRSKPPASNRSATASPPAAAPTRTRLPSQRSEVRSEHPHPPPSRRAAMLMLTPQVPNQVILPTRTPTKSR